MENNSLVIRIFPQPVALWCATGPVGEFLSLADAPLTRAQRLKGCVMPSVTRIGRMLWHLRSAFAAEADGRWTAADHHWAEVVFDFSILSANPQDWPPIGDHAGPEVAARFGSEVLAETSRDIAAGLLALDAPDFERVDAHLSRLLAWSPEADARLEAVEEMSVILVATGLRLGKWGRVGPLLRRLQREFPNSLAIGRQSTQGRFHETLSILEV